MTSKQYPLDPSSTSHYQIETVIPNSLTRPELKKQPNDKLTGKKKLLVAQDNTSHYKGIIVKAPPELPSTDWPIGRLIILLLTVIHNDHSLNLPEAQYHKRAVPLLEYTS
jgi:hypothetical protein